MRTRKSIRPCSISPGLARWLAALALVAASPRPGADAARAPAGNRRWRPSRAAASGAWRPPFDEGCRRDRHDPGYTGGTSPTRPTSRSRTAAPATASGPGHLRSRQGQLRSSCSTGLLAQHRSRSMPGASSATTAANTTAAIFVARRGAEEDRRGEQAGADRRGPLRASRSRPRSWRPARSTRPRTITRTTTGKTRTGTVLPDRLRARRAAGEVWGQPANPPSVTQ